MKLAPSGVTLEAVKDPKAEFAGAARSKWPRPDISGTEKTSQRQREPVRSDPQAGNLARGDRSCPPFPGVQLIPGAEGNPDQFSVFAIERIEIGTYRRSMKARLFGGSRHPRDARRRAPHSAPRPWDVSRRRIQAFGASFTSPSNTASSATRFSSKRR